MRTVRIFMPSGAGHLRFEGVDKLTFTNPEFIAFTYLVRDINGNATDKTARAVFCLKVICGYSVEGGE